ncbi:DUF3237 domain-containing protein [Pseudorhodoplanes sp.]|uniref:DUF3237 domain-containing protein n=1 Tax=Pseudorhodoplanes sp. TaxID=1934341 RepID=UPI00391BC039
MTLLSPEPILRVNAELADILQFGATPIGERRVINILGGTVTGKVTGQILPGGADWQFIRADGAAHVEARYTIRADSGALILVSSEGLRHGPPEVLARLLTGEAVDPSLYYFRTCMRFETGDRELDWLNRVIAIARGAREKNAVKLDVHEVL